MRWQNIDASVSHLLFPYCSSVVYTYAPNNYFTARINCVNKTKINILTVYRTPYAYQYDGGNHEIFNKTISGYFDALVAITLHLIHMRY